MTRRHPTSGLSLVEVLVALLVFAVIGTAAFAMLDQTLRSENISQARLSRLADMQRTVRVLSVDTLQVVAGSVTRTSDGVSFLRRGAMQTAGGTGAEGLVVRYQLTGGQLIRDIGVPGADPARQVLLTGLTGGSWQLVQDGTALPDTAPTLGTQGIQMLLDLGPAGTLRGLFPVPYDAPPPP